MLQKADCREKKYEDNCEETNMDCKYDIREKWSRQIESVLSCVGFTVGFGNIWRFPYLCMMNGGGAFLIPYYICIFIIGIPLYFLELCLGQFSSSTPVTVWNMCPLFKGVGWAILISSSIWTMNCMLIFAQILYYLVMSLRSEVPWKSCNNYWNTANCYSWASQYNTTLENTTLYSNETIEHVKADRRSSAEEFFSYKMLDISDGIENLGIIKWDLLLSLLGAWVIIFVCVFRGIKASGKVVYVTALAPYVLLTILLVRGVTLPGSMKGIIYFIKPNIRKLSDINVWIEACLQVFFSLGPGWGGIITYSSYNKFHNNCMRDAVFISFVCGGTSLFAGFVVFAVIGFLSHLSGLPMKDVVTQGPGLAFIAYPEAIAHLPVSPLWSITFFLMLTLVALDSMFGTVESIISGIVDEFPKQLRNRRLLVTICTVGSLFVMGLPLVTRGGIYIFQIIDWYALTFSTMVITFLECVIVTYVYGVGRFYSDLSLMLKRRPSILWAVMWCAITPALIAILFIVSALRMTPPQYGDYVYPNWAIGIGWFFAMLSISVIPFIIIYKLCRTEGTFRQKFRTLLKPSDDWGPSDPRYSTQYRAQNRASDNSSWRARMTISDKPDLLNLIELKEDVTPCISQIA